MSKFFPQPKNIKINSDVELIAFQCQDIVVQLVSLAPGANFELHQHPESQMGMVIAGRLEMNVNGIKEIIEPLQKVYIASSHVPHGSVNYFSETALVFDVKRITTALPSQKNDEFFLSPSPKKDDATHFPCESFVASWFEIVISQIPPGQEISFHQSKSEEMGIILNGQLMMTVGEQQQQLEYGNIYYAPADVLCGGHNSSEEAVTLIKILIPPHSHFPYKDTSLDRNAARLLTAS